MDTNTNTCDVRLALFAQIIGIVLGWNLGGFIVIVCWKRECDFLCFLYLKIDLETWNDCLCDLQLLRLRNNSWSDPMVEILEVPTIETLTLHLYCPSSWSTKFSSPIHRSNSHMAFNCKLSIPLYLFLKKLLMIRRSKFDKFRTWNNKLNHKSYKNIFNHIKCTKFQHMWFIDYDKVKCSHCMSS